MEYDLIFKIINLLDFVPWLFLLVRPHNEQTRKVINFYLVLFSMTYAGLIFSNFGLLWTDLSSFQGISNVFAQPPILLAGWVHFLAFDLITARWIVSDAKENLISHAKTVPCLIMTCLLGPVGYLMYQIVKLKRPALKNRM